MLVETLFADLGPLSSLLPGSLGLPHSSQSGWCSRLVREKEGCEQLGSIDKVMELFRVEGIRGRHWGTVTWGRRLCLHDVEHDDEDNGDGHDKDGGHGNDQSGSQVSLA